MKAKVTEIIRKNGTIKLMMDILDGSIDLKNRGH